MAIKKDYKKLTQQTKKKKQAKNAAQDGFKEDKEKRLIRLIKLMLIAFDGVLNVDKTANELGVSKRTIQRDIDVLNKAGFNLYKVNEQNSNYHIDKDWHFGSLNITAENLKSSLQALKAIKLFYEKPQELISPVQKTALEWGNSKKGYLVGGKYKLKDVTLSRDQIRCFLLQGLTSNQGACDRFMQYITLIDMMSDYMDISGFRRFYLDKKRKEATRTFVHMLRLNHDYKSCDEYCRKIIKSEPKTPWVYSEAAFNCFEHTNDIQKAVSYIAEGIKANPKDKDLYIYFALLSEAAGNYDDAVNFFKYGAAYDFDKYVYCAKVYYRAGKYEQALQEVNSALKLMPEHPVCEQLKEDIKKAVKKAKKQKNTENAVTETKS